MPPSSWDADPSMVQLALRQLPLKLATGAAFTGGGEPPPPPSITRSRRLGVPAGAPFTTPKVAFERMAAETCAGEAVGLASRYAAAAPATNAAACEVPE